MKVKLKLYLWLAGVNLLISAFTFGGGYIVVPMVRKYFVQRKALFSEEELMEMAAVSQSAPGAIAVNMTALAGYRTAGITGLVISCVSAVLPAIVLLSLISLCYQAVISNAVAVAVLKGMQAGVGALVVDFVADMTQNILKEKSLFPVFLMTASFLLSFILNFNIAAILAGSCVLCILRVILRKGKEQ